MSEPLVPDDSSDQKKKKKRRSTRRHKVHPQGNNSVTTPELGLEMKPSPQFNGVVTDGLVGEKTPQNDQHKSGKHSQSAANIFRVGQKVKEGAEKFKDLKTKKWKPSTHTNRGNQGVLGIERDPIPDPFKPNPQNEELISYFAQLAIDTSEETNVDLDYVENILMRGANVNCTDKHGQTVLHEACRAWEVDVAQFLLEKGADLNKSDLHGRTPLHVSAAVDYPGMITLLLDNGAEIESLTKGENQTPMHFAARNDACEALKLLLKAGANIHCRDYKGRTPLQIAAELDRSETAKFLLELGADASDKDDSGQPALVLMITKMPAVAGEALDQLHRMDRANRKQYFDLHHLEPAKPDEKDARRTALQVVVQYNQLELIMHPVFQRLIDVKWRKFGKFGSLKQVAFALTFNIVWTIIALALEEPVVYDLPQDTWRLILGLFAVALTIYQIYLELQEFFRSKKKFEAWKKWRCSEIKRDFAYCHPRWPQEESFLQCEIDDIQSQTPEYFSDHWNYFDWFVYALLMAISVMHMVDIFIDAQGLSSITKRIFAVAVIFIWLRFMKTARAFQALGPFIVMLGHIAVDLGRFVFLYVEFYIPYACAFWMIFGNTEVQGMVTVDELLFTLFRMTLVDEYDYEGMKKVDIIMAYILVTTFLTLSAILCLNLLIALLSDTFQRVYDNAKSNAVMQQASIILSIEEGLSKKKRTKFRNFIHTQCAPDAMFYDDDQTAASDGSDLKKVTFQIKDALEELSEQLSNDTTLQDAADTAATMQEEISLLHTKQDKYTKQVKKMSQDMKEMKQMMETLISAHNAESSRRQAGNHRPSYNQVSPRPSDNRHDSSSDSSDDDSNQPPSRPRFAGRRTSTPRGAKQRTQGYEIRSPVEPPLGIESLLSQSFSLGPHKIPSVLLPSREEPHLDESQRLQQLRKEKQKQQKLRREKEDSFQQQRQEGGNASDATTGSQGQHSINSVSIAVAQQGKSQSGSAGDSTN